MAKNVDKKELFESMPVRKALLTLAVPTIISQLINLIYNTADAIYLGQTGDAYKTASVTLAFTVFLLTLSFFNLFGVGGGSLIARLSGRGEEEKAKSVSAFSFWGGVAIALLYSLIILVFETPLLKLLGASENTEGYARQYIFYVVILGNLPVILSGVCSHLLRNAGYAKQAGFGLSAGGVLNIILDPLFMFVILPKGMEVTGAAVATLISNAAACTYMVITVVRLSKKSVLSADPREIRNIGKKELKELFSVGVPSAILTGLFDIANVFLNALMSAYGDLQLAAIGIVAKIERLPNAICIGICQGMMPLVAYNFASGNHKRMNEVIKTTRILGVCISLGCLALFQIIAPWLCKAFLSVKNGGDTEAAAVTLTFAETFLRIRVCASVFQFFNYSGSFTMQGVGYGFGTLLHAVVRIVVLYIPFMYLFSWLFQENGLAMALVAGEALGAVFVLLLFRRWKKKHLNLFTEEVPGSGPEPEVFEQDGGLSK